MHPTLPCAPDPPLCTRPSPVHLTLPCAPDPPLCAQQLVCAPHAVCFFQFSDSTLLLCSTVSECPLHGLFLLLFYLPSLCAQQLVSSPHAGCFFQCSNSTLPFHLTVIKCPSCRLFLCFFFSAVRSTTSEYLLHGLFLSDLTHPVHLTIGE